MKKDNNEKILRSSLSTLLKRFSGTDLISSLDKEYALSGGRIKLSLVDDNHILKKARINESKLEKTIQTIEEKGISTPIYVVENGERYEAIYPRILYIAALKLKLESIPYSVIHYQEDELIVFLATQIRDSKDANIVELSLLLNCLKKKYKYKQSEIASMMQQSRSQITNIMRLIKMPDWVLRDITNNKLSFGHARALTALDEKDIEEIVPQIYLNNWSVRHLEKVIYEKQHSNSLSKEEKKISKKFSCKVNVRPRQITLNFDSDEEREKFINKLFK